MKHTYLVTGATGFVGSWITRSLVEKGENVSIIVRNKKLNWRLEDIAQNLAVYECDLQSTHIEKIVDEIKPTVVFHIAALGALPKQQTKAEQLIDTNVAGLINIINAVKKYDLHLFINTGSSSEYGLKDKPMTETDLLVPINDYAVSKAAATLYAQRMALTEKLPIITLRLFSPFGYYDDKNRLVSYVITQALRNKPISLSSKTNIRDFIYVEDVINAYFKVLDKKLPPGEIINIGSGHQHSVYDIVENILTITGSKSIISWGSMPTQSRQIEPDIWQADISKAEKLLGWKPQFSIEEGLRKTVEYYKAYE